METAAFDLATQWPILAIFIVAFGAFWKIAADNRKAEHDFANEQRAWQEEMGKKRDTEQEKRDQAWRVFLADMQKRSDATTLRSAEVQGKLIERIDTLTAAINQHDVYTRAKMVRYDNLADAILQEEK